MEEHTTASSTLSRRTALRARAILLRGLTGGEVDARADSAADWPTLWARCWARIRSWSIPPRWSWRDWWDEARAQGALAAHRAGTEFDAQRGVPREAFLFRRVVAAVWTCYRQEWSFGRRSRPAEAIPDRHAPEPNLPDAELIDHLASLLDSLDESERRLIRQLFWDGRREDELAREWGVSRQAVNKRKQKILCELRQRVGVP
jgi:RNA polymerase sigma factor (sigma-70 family)